MAHEPEMAVANAGLKVDEALSARFLDIVSELVWELHPHLRRSTPVKLDSNLDRDLSLDSLGRAELILRLDRAFKVRLPDQLLNEANTPADLLIALLAAGPEGPAMPEATVAAPFAKAEEPPPASAQTLIETLLYIMCMVMPCDHTFASGAA